MYGLWSGYETHMNPIHNDCWFESSVNSEGIETIVNFS